MLAVPREALQTVGVDILPDEGSRVPQHFPDRMRSKGVPAIAACDRPVRTLDVDVERCEGHATQRSILLEKIDRAEVGELRDRELSDLLEAALHCGLFIERLAPLEQESHAAF